MGEVFLDEHIDDHSVGELALFHDRGYQKVCVWVIT
jgi:hypothetical protein